MFLPNFDLALAAFDDELGQVEMFVDVVVRLTKRRRAGMLRRMSVTSSGRSSIRSRPVRYRIVVMDALGDVLEGIVFAGARRGDD